MPNQMNNSKPNGSLHDLNSADHAFFRKFNSLIREKESNGSLKVSALAQSLRMSRISLFRKIKKITGKSVVEYIRDNKLLKARDLVLTTGKPMTEIAYEVGFSDPCYFSKKYAQKFGCSPLAHRKSKV